MIEATHPSLWILHCASYLLASNVSLLAIVFQLTKKKSLALQFNSGLKPSPAPSFFFFLFWQRESKKIHASV